MWIFRTKIWFPFIYFLQSHCRLFAAHPSKRWRHNVPGDRQRRNSNYCQVMAALLFAFVVRWRAPAATEQVRIRTTMSHCYCAWCICASALFRLVSQRQELGLTSHRSSTESKDIFEDFLEKIREDFSKLQVLLEIFKTISKILVAIQILILMLQNLKTRNDYAEQVLPYFSDVKRDITSLLDRKPSSEQVLQVYEMCALILNRCARIVYSKVLWK